jgi:RHS repeat-associated protein
VGGVIFDWISKKAEEGRLTVLREARRLQFASKERDSEASLDFFGARYMSAAQGRFTSPDPNSAGASLFDPQSWNAYSYVNNRPLSYVDPGGDVPIPVITGAGGAGVGALVGGGFEAWRQYAKDGRVTSWGKVRTAAGGGFISGVLSGLTLRLGAAAGAATTAEVVMVNASSNVIAGYAQRRADEALGYEAPMDNATELTNVALDAGTGAVIAWGGAMVADRLFPIPNVQREIALLRFASRRSTRPARIQAAQRQAELQAGANSIVGGISGGVPTEGVKWLWQWLRPRPSQQTKKEAVTSRICYGDGNCGDAK